MKNKNVTLVCDDTFDGIMTAIYDGWVLMNKGCIKLRFGILRMLYTESLDSKIHTNRTKQVCLDFMGRTVRKDSSDRCDRHFEICLERTFCAGILWSLHSC